MGLDDELSKFANGVLASNWSRRAGRKVPDSSSVTFGNDAVDLDATILYADLAGSTKLVSDFKDWFAAKIYKAYLYSAAKIIRARSGVITAYDGDRIMAVFIGNNKNTAAAKCALQITYVVREIIQPAIDARNFSTSYEVKHKVGIDTSGVMVAKTGIRGSDDLVWVGNSANNAAKLAALSRGYSAYITDNVYGMLHESSKYGGEPGRNMWTDLGTGDLGYRIFGSGWQWAI